MIYLWTKHKVKIIMENLEFNSGNVANMKSKGLRLAWWVCFLSISTACQNKESSNSQIPLRESSSSLRPVSLEQFLSEAPPGRYLLSDSRSDEPLLYLRFAMDSGKVLSARVAGFPSVSPYTASSVCTFCPSDHPGHGKALQGLRLLEELRPGRRGWIGGQMLDPTLGYRYLADLEQGNGSDLSIVLRVGSQRRVLWLRKVESP
jgi:hypothetical protein